jgi:hypothetical protein
MTTMTTVLRFISLEMGGIHPLAKKVDIPLEIRLPMNMLDMRADIIGEHIVLILVDLRPDNLEDDTIYLVDWKQGTMSLIRSNPFFFLMTRMGSAPLRGSSDRMGRTRARSLYSPPTLSQSCHVDS